MERNFAAYYLRGRKRCFLSETARDTVCAPRREGQLVSVLHERERLLGAHLLIGCFGGCLPLVVVVKCVVIAQNAECGTADKWTLLFRTSAISLAITWALFERQIREVKDVYCVGTRGQRILRLRRAVGLSEHVIVVADVLHLDLRCSLRAVGRQYFSRLLLDRLGCHARESMSFYCVY